MTETARIFTVAANSSALASMLHGETRSREGRCFGIPSILKFNMADQQVFGGHVSLCWAHILGYNRVGSVLASLTSSLSNGRRRREERGPKLLVQTLLGLPRQFVVEQAHAERVYGFHLQANGFFPRPCPECSSGEFFVRAPQSAGGDSTAQSSRRHVAFDSRPVICDQCARWFHAGCLGARCGSLALFLILLCSLCISVLNPRRCVDDLPVHPWLHCQGCRDTFVKLEALRQRGPQLYPLGPNGPLTYTLVTPADMAGFMSNLVQGASVGELNRKQRAGPASPNHVLSVLELLGETGYDLKTIRSDADGLASSTLHPFSSLLPPPHLSGYGDPSTEYEGGKYAILVHSEEGAPVATATFNVFSAGLPLQVSLVADSKQSPGHVEPLFEILSSLVQDLDIGSITLQPPEGADISWTKQLGFKPMHPSAVSELHMRVPLAYLDAPVLELEV